MNYQRCTLAKGLFSPCYKEFYTFTWCCREHPHLHSPECPIRCIKMITWLLFPNILVQGKLFVLFKRSYLWKIVFCCHLLLLWDEVSTRGSTWWRFMLTFWYKWIPASVTLRYHSYKRIPHNIARRHYLDKYVL